MVVGEAMLGDVVMGIPCHKLYIYPIKHTNVIIPLPAHPRGSQFWYQFVGWLFHGLITGKGMKPSRVWYTVLHMNYLIIITSCHTQSIGHWSGGSCRTSNGVRRRVSLTIFPSILEQSIFRRRITIDNTPRKKCWSLSPFLHLIHESPDGDGFAVCPHAWIFV